MQLRRITYRHPWYESDYLMYNCQVIVPYLQLLFLATSAGVPAVTASLLKEGSACGRWVQRPPVGVVFAELFWIS